MDNENIKTYKESNVTDFTNSPDEFCETEPKIKLNSGIDIRYDLYEMKLWMGILLLFFRCSYEFIINRNQYK